jgi:hypothetical protein
MSQLRSKAGVALALILVAAFVAAAFVALAFNDVTAAERSAVALGSALGVSQQPVCTSSAPNQNLSSHCSPVARIAVRPSCSVASVAAAGRDVPWASPGSSITPLRI